jgi:glutathione S-transferase
VDRRYRLNLFPKNLDRMQLILSRYIENDLESVGFKVNDTYVIPTRPLIERTMLIHHKERKFGRGCVQEWSSHRRSLCNQFAELLKPIDNMLAASSFLLTDRPLFVDYNLSDVLGNRSGFASLDSLCQFISGTWRVEPTQRKAVRAGSPSTRDRACVRQARDAA